MSLDLDYSLLSTQKRVYEYTAALNQITFSGADAAGNVLAIDTNSTVKVYVNEVLQTSGVVSNSTNNNVTFSSAPNTDSGTYTVTIIIVDAATDTTFLTTVTSESLDAETYIEVNDPAYDPLDTNTYYSDIKIESYLDDLEYATEDFAVSSSLSSLNFAIAEATDLFLEEKNGQEPIQFDYNYEYWFDGLRHRKHGLPAVYHRNGEIEKYYVNGEKHNLYGYAIKLEPEGHFQGYNEYWVDGVLVSSHQFEFLQKRFYRTLKEERKLLTEYWCKWFEWLMDMSEDARDPKTNIIRGVKYFEKRMSELGLHFGDSDTPEKFNMKLNKNNYITN